MYFPCVCMDDFSKTDGKSQQCLLIAMLFLRMIYNFWTAKVISIMVKCLLQVFNPF